MERGVYPPSSLQQHGSTEVAAKGVCNSMKTQEGVRWRRAEGAMGLGEELRIGFEGKAERAESEERRDWGASVTCYGSTECYFCK